MIGRFLPRWSPEFRAVWRTHALDLLTTALLFVSVSLAVGRVWRFPFDDEVYNLNVIDTGSLGQILTFYSTGGDVHPALSYLWFAVLWKLGFDEGAMRLLSLAMTGLSLVIVQALTLQWLAARRDGLVAPTTRVVAVLMFGLCALAVSQGDALRWYPLFSLEIALALALYLAGANVASLLWSAAVLGIAASTNFLAAFVLGPLALYRYRLQRRFLLRVELAFWALVVGFGSLGAAAAASLFLANRRMAGTQFMGVAQAAASDVLGFFGGHTLGLGQAWLIAGVVIVAVVACWQAVDRGRPGAPMHLFLLLLVAVLALPLVGFGKPRSFLYLAPVMAAVLTLYFDRQFARRTGLACLLLGLTLAPSLGAIGAIEGGRHPFKRNSAIPYGAVVDFIASNGEGRVLVVTTDSVLPWLMSRDSRTGSDCVVLVANRRGCFAPGTSYDTVILAYGHSNVSDKPAAMQRYRDSVSRAVAGKRKVAVFHAGIDEDAALKSRLTGVPLDRAILTLEIYR